MEVPAKLRSALVGIRYCLFALLFLATATLLVSCGSSSVKVVKGPDNIAITVSSDTTHPNENVTVTVTIVDDNGNPLDNTTVDFALTINNSSGGLSAKSAVTDINGQASIIYRAGLKSDVTDRVTATVTIKGADNLELVKSAFVSIKVEPTLIGSITVASGNPTLVANGTNKTAIRATLLDVNNAPVAGTIVAFSTTLGSIGSSATTNIDGIAEVSLTAGVIPGTATVTAVGGGFTGEVKVTFVAGAPCCGEDDIVVTALPESVDPNGQTEITATVRDENGNPIQGETVNFSIETNASGGSLDPVSGLTDVNGQARVTYTAGSSVGTDTIKARSASNESVSGTVDVEVSAGSIVVGSVSVVAGTGTLIADGTSSTVIRATVLDTNGQLASNILVNFSTTAGNLSPLSDTTDANGIAEVLLTSATNLGTATITANARGFIDTTEVIFIAGGVGKVTLTANPANIPADGTSTSTISALVTDDDGNPVADGELVSFSILFGSGTLSSITAPTVNGIAAVTYKSPLSGASATIKGESTNGESGTVTVFFTTEQIGSISLTITNDILVANGSQSTLATAVVENTEGNPVSDGTEVTFTIPTLGGDVNGSNPSVNVSTTGGIAVVVLSASTHAGQYIMTATSGGVGQLAPYELIPGPAAAINTELSANPEQIDADGISTSLITLLAEDAFGNPVADGTTVNFYTNLGSLSAATAPTALGMATVTLTSGTTDGQATVTAVIDGVTVDVAVDFGFVAGEGTGTATTIQLSVSSQTIRVKGSGGQESTVITATARDETGNFITDCPDTTNFPAPPAQTGGNMKFEIVNSPGGGEKLDGIGSTVTKGTSNGTATVSLTSGTISGTVTIKVSVILDGICGNGTVQGGNYGVDPYDEAPPYAVALTTPIGIEAGEPANIVIFRPSEVKSNKSDGSISQIISALVQDQYSNPVENGTVIFFGCVDNPPTSQYPYRNGYKVAGEEGDTTLTNAARFESLTFISLSSAMSFDDVAVGDTLIILEGRDEGGHIISNTIPANPNRIELSNDLLGDETELPFVAGTAELGTVCGSVSTGNLEPDGTCTPASGVSIKGVAHSRLTWTPQGIFKPFYCYAESVGRTVGDAIGDLYPAVAPVSITVTINPPIVISGEDNIEVFAEFKDGDGHLIPNEEITFSSGNPLVASFGGPPPGGAATTTDTTGSDGRATTADLDTLTCLNEQTSVIITATSGPYSGNATLTIQPTAPTADFTCTDAGDGINANCTDDSTTPTGTVINSWAWDIGCDTTTDSTDQNPTLNLGPGSTAVCLTVNNNTTPACSDSLTKSVTIAAGAPLANFTSNEPGTGNGRLNFNDSSSPASGTTNTTWAWVFPTGTVPLTSSNQNPGNVDFTAVGLGPHNVQLTVTNNFGVSDNVTKAVSVDITPSALASVVDNSTTNPCELIITDNGSSSPGSSTVTTWAWTFTADPTGAAIVTVSSAKNPGAVTFPSGTPDVDVDLTVTNNFGVTDSIITINRLVNTCP